MRIIKNNFCQIYFSENSLNTQKIEFDNYSVGIFSYKDLLIDSEFKIPTLIVGWDFVKNNFNDIKISSNKIKNNLYWTFSNEEDKETNENFIKSFIDKALKDYLPKNFRSYDFILDENILLNYNNLFLEENNFCFLSKELLYVYNETNFFSINLESISYTQITKQEYIKNIIKKYKCIFFNYENISSYVEECYDLEIITLENICWICNNFLLNENSLYKFSPLKINEKYYSFLMFKFYEILNCSLSQNINNSLNRLFKKDFITNWLSKKHITFKGNKKLILKYSNKRTITGRINCIDKRFNPQMLPKNSPVRNEIISEFQNGKIAIFDFVSFETKLSVYLTKDQEFIDKFQNSDLHTETAKKIFEKNNISDFERNTAKQINHAIIYGIGNEKLKNILLESNLSIKKIDKIKDFLKPILINSKKFTDSLKTKGYIQNPYNTIIYPNKDWAAYNNYVQSIAADIVVDKLFKIKHFLKNKKSNFMYQVHDSFVFDIHPEELNTIEEIKKLLEKNGKYNFQINYIQGETLLDCTNQNKEEEIEYIN